MFGHIFSMFGVELLSSSQIVAIIVLSTVALAVAVIVLVIGRRGPQGDPTRPEFLSLIKEYGLTSAPSRANYFAAAVLVVVLFVAYCTYTTSLTYQNSKVIASRVEKEAHYFLPNPAVRLCLGPKNAYKPSSVAAECKVDSVNFVPNVTYLESGQDSYRCFDANIAGNSTTATGKRNVPYNPIIFDLSGEFCSSRMPLYAGAEVLLALPDATGSAEFQTIQFDTLIASIGFTTSVWVEYTKHVGIDGSVTMNLKYSSSVAVLGERYIAPSWPCNREGRASVGVRVYVASLDVLTTTDYPLAAMSDVLPTLVAAIGTFYVCFNRITWFLAKKFHIYRRVEGAVDKPLLDVAGNGDANM